MPDLGNRANVMGPQPLGPVRQPEPAMLETIDTILAALMAGKKDEVLALTDEKTRERMAQIADSIAPNEYDRSEILGKARIAEHYFIKARLHGRNRNPFTLQFRIGPDNGKWTVREAVSLTNVRSAWTK